jgi:hypothetical protein
MVPAPLQRRQVRRIMDEPFSRLFSPGSPLSF